MTQPIISSAAQRLSSPAAESAESEGRNDRSERSCRRSGAAPCCAAVGTPELLPRHPNAAPEPKHISHRKPKPASEQNSRATRSPKRCARAGDFQPQKRRREYSHRAQPSFSDRSTHATTRFSKRSSTTLSSPAARPVTTTPRQSRRVRKREDCGRSGAAPCWGACLRLLS